MTRKRGRAATKSATDEAESPVKRVKFENVSNQNETDEEEQEEQENSQMNREDNVTKRVTRQSSKPDIIKAKLKIQFKPTKNVQTKKTGRNVRAKKDSESEASGSEQMPDKQLNVEEKENLKEVPIPKEDEKLEDSGSLSNEKVGNVKIMPEAQEKEKSTDPDDVTNQLSDENAEVENMGVENLDLEKDRTIDSDHFMNELLNINEDVQNLEKVAKENSYSPFDRLPNVDEVENLESVPAPQESFDSVVIEPMNMNQNVEVWGTVTVPHKSLNEELVVGKQVEIDCSNNNPYEEPIKSTTYSANDSDLHLSQLFLDLEDLHQVQSSEQHHIVLHADVIDADIIVPTHPSVDPVIENRIIVPAKPSVDNVIENRIIVPTEPSVDPVIENRIIVPTELSVDPVIENRIIVPTQPSMDPVIENRNEETFEYEQHENENAENENSENILVDTNNIDSNQDETKAQSPILEKITPEILDKAAEKLRIKKAKSTKVKSTVSFKSKSKGKRHKVKTAKTEVVPKSSSTQDVINEEDEIICRVCDQKVDNDLIYDSGEPQGGLEEGAAILDPRLQLFDGDEADTSTEDTRSYNKITSFSIFCKNGHLCHFDSGLIEKDVEIYFSGYVKPIHSDDPSPNDGVPAKKFGPIVWWWLTGFDVGEQPTVGLSTELGDYICMEPSEDYAPFMRTVMTKIYISKIVIELIIYQPNASYEDLLAKLQTATVPDDLLKNFTEDTLLHYAPFICEQVITFDDIAKPKEQLLVTAPCIRRLIDLAGIRFEVDTPKSPQKVNQIFRERQFEHKIDYREKLLRQVAEERKENSNASELIDNLLPIHEKHLTSEQVKPWRCGACDRCLRSQCRECKACRTRNYEACYQRRCFNGEIMEENEEDAKDEMDFFEMEAEDAFTHYRNAVRPLTRHAYDIAWSAKPLAREQKRTYYGSIYVDGNLISPGDFIELRSSNAGVPPQIMKVMYLFEDESGGPTQKIHARFYWSGKYTVLGDISDRKELFCLDRCLDVDVHCILRKVKVLERAYNELDQTIIEDQREYPYVCVRSYDPTDGSFHDLQPQDEADRDKYGASYRYCYVCDYNNVKRAENTPKVVNPIEEINGKIIYESVQYKGEEYRVGSAVYLKPNKSIYFKYPMLNSQPQVNSTNVDEDKFSELYRKAKDEEPKQDVAAPFNIGYITEIFTTNGGKIFFKVLKMYRPENTHKSDKLSKNADVNLLYWSDEDATVSIICVVGKCYITHQSSTPNIDEWSRQGPDRFYFHQIYRNNEIEDIDRGDYGCPNELCDAPPYPDVKLKTLNIFAGCGGLALGLQQSGAAECKWAIEPDKASALTFKINHPETAVFNATSIEMMQKITRKDFKVNSLRLPKKGDVDLLCATLPPESWRSINTLNALKSSNIATFLLYLEYYQPPFFVLEADDVLLKRSIVLKLALASFIRLGYQVAFDLVQVGNFGPPQNCYRTVITGAIRGRQLPDCPKSQHVFSKSASQEFVVVDNRSYQRRNWTESAPYKATTVRDAILDLAVFDPREDGVVAYKTQSISFYHRMMRYGLSESEKTKVNNHVTKDMGPLVHARMTQIPPNVGTDWRNLPNIKLKLRDESHTKKLKYSYDDPELGKGKQGQPRGVCSCSVGKPCDPSNVQENTLIPWHLVHSGKRHGHWAGLYGKLHWTGVFVGTTTNPEPLAKKAPVIHPSKSRVLSVRECARAQGFPDNFEFSNGPIHDMYRQIGMSTSPLLARAIGHEIAKKAALYV